MVDAETLLDSGLAHVVAIVLGLVGVAALLAGGATASAAWFWLVYLIIWGSFLNLFREGSSWWRRGDSDDETVEETRESEDPVTVLRHRYATGEIDDAEFEARLDALLETPETQAELAAVRNRS